MASFKNPPKDLFPKSIFPFLLANSPAFCSVAAVFFVVSILGRSPRTGGDSFVAPQLIITSNSSASCTRLSPAAPKNRSDSIHGPAPPLRDQRWSAGGADGPNQDPASCDLFDGEWVVDESSPSYQPGSCPFVDDSFNCFKNGRRDSNYTRLRWRPKGCMLPRVEGRRMLEMLRGKRLAFVGDSLNRNMWESLVCILRSSLRRKHRILEVSGRREFKSDGSYAYRFIEYNCTIEFFRSAFLVQEWEATDSNGSRRETLRLDLMDKSSAMYRDADVLVFNTGHWWTHDKTSQGKNYYQEGSHVYSQLSAAEAYRKALNTWARWVDASIDSPRTRVFFRGFSSNHFNGGQWNSSGSCEGETEPITNDEHLGRYPSFGTVLESVIGGMRTPIAYLNVTTMTAYRKDAHPSVFREAGAHKRPGWSQDCSHWCLPGVPDAWNELLYAMLLGGSQSI